MLQVIGEKRLFHEVIRRGRKNSNSMIFSTQSFKSEGKSAKIRAALMMMTKKLSARENFLFELNNCMNFILVYSFNDEPNIHDYKGASNFDLQGRRRCLRIGDFDE